MKRGWRGREGEIERRQVGEEGTGRRRGQRGKAGRSNEAGEKKDRGQEGKWREGERAKVKT